VTTVGFLHTADAHIPVFDVLVQQVSPGDETVHLVDASLLTDAGRRGGVDDDLRDRIGRRLEELHSQGATAVLCSCSTIGAAAEERGAGLGLPTLRVDRPLAEEAVRKGGRIAVVVAVESSLAPTRQLLTETALAAGHPVTIVDAPCLEAWPYWEQGDVDRYLATLADHVEHLDGTVDVIVLAQASMAPVEQRVRLTTPLLSSPRLAVRALLTRQEPGPDGRSGREADG
jgi:hypothetical protein